MMSEVTLPRRQRRRPALSCVECRRRKIKCDRKTPCSNCLQYKSTMCTYPDSHPLITNRRTAPKATPTSTSVHEHQRVPEAAGLTSLISGSPFSEISPVPQSRPSLVDSPQSERSAFAFGSPSEKNAQNLNNRTRNLEQTPVSSTSPNKQSEEVMSFLGADFSSFGDVLLMVGHPPMASKQKNSAEKSKLNSDKTQFFGRSHYMNTFNMFSRVCRFKDEDGKFMIGIEPTEVREILEKCRRMVKTAKTESRTGWHSMPNFQDCIPQREVADKLVDLYLRTCESTYRILHIPSFKQGYAEYWNDPASVKTPSVLAILLVMAIGACFYQGEADDELQSKARQWVQAAESWMAAPLGKKQLTISSIQIYCLLLLARQTSSVGADFLWMPSGNLLRMAFSMGLHRDPKHFPKISLFAAEMRRRIWATVLEMAVQTSMDVGMPPLISTRDFDTEPPFNIDDEDISPTTIVMPRPKPSHVCTKTSIQITLLKSLRTRLEIVHFINSFHSEPSYDEVLRFGQDITKACNDASRLVHSYPANRPRPSALQSILLDIFIRRFLLEVHRPFLARSHTDPRYYFSRKVCLETALVLLFHSAAKDLPPDHDPHIVDDYEQLKRAGGGLFKPVIFYATTIITVELILQLEEDITSGLPPSAQTKASREPLYRAVDDMDKLMLERFRRGDEYARGPIFFNAAAAKIHAMTNGIPPEQVVPEAAKRSARECLEILTAKAHLGTRNYGEESQPESHGSGGSGSIGEQDFDFDLLMTDPNMDFGMTGGDYGVDIPDSWLFTGWDAN